MTQGVNVSLKNVNTYYSSIEKRNHKQHFFDFLTINLISKMSIMEKNWKI